MNLMNILLQGNGANNYSGIIMIVAMIAVFYFFMIRPQQKKQKELKKQRDAMKNGDKVVTAGGIHGKIRSLKDNTVLVTVAEGVTIEIDRNSVYPYVEQAGPAK